MNRKMIIGVALLLAVVAVVGIWMPQIQKWQDERAYRKERQRKDEGYAFGNRWMDRMNSFFKVQRTPEETAKWYKQAKKEFCSDPDRQKMDPNVEATTEVTLFSLSPDPLSCSDISSNNPQ